MWVAAYLSSHGITAKKRNWRDLSAALYKQAKAAA